eukprot:6202895-Pleurochrysis_carterae.AAC.1
MPRICSSACREKGHGLAACLSTIPYGVHRLRTTIKGLLERSSAASVNLANLHSAEISRVTAVRNPRCPCDAEQRASQVRLRKKQQRPQKGLDERCPLTKRSENEGGVEKLVWELQIQEKTQATGGKRVSGKGRWAGKRGGIGAEGRESMKRAKQAGWKESQRAGKTD